MKRIKAFINRIKRVRTNTKGLFRSIGYLLKEPKTSKVFHGYFRWSLSKLYAVKRYSWYPYVDVMGKDQGVFEHGAYAYIVISPREIKLLKKRGHIPYPKNYRKIFKRENVFRAS